MWGCASALRKNCLAATASRRTGSRKSMVWPKLAHRPIQIDPDTFDLDAGLVHPPGAGAGRRCRRTRSSSVAAQACTQRNRVVWSTECLDPTDRGQIAVADREGQISAQRSQNHFGCEVPPLERAVLTRRHRPVRPPFPGSRPQPHPPRLLQHSRNLWSEGVCRAASVSPAHRLQCRCKGGLPRRIKAT